MFKKAYTAVAVFLLTLLLTVVGGIGAKHLFLFLVDTDWLVVSSVVCGTILLAILSDLCYNYFVKHRETATDALKGFRDDLEAVWQIIVKFFTPPLLKKTLTYVFVFLVLLSFCIGSAVVFRGFVEAYDKVTRFDEKIKDIEGSYASRVDRQENEIEALKKSDHEKSEIITKMTSDMEILKSDNLSLLNTVKRTFSTGDTKNSLSRPYSLLRPAVNQ